MNILVRFGALGAAVALSVALTACGNTTDANSNSSTESHSASSSPGGTATSTVSTSPAMTSGGAMPMPAAPAGPHNQADITFAQMMTVHHQGAIEMADLVPSRASSPKVKALAAKIKAAQAPEIKQMSGWLASWAPDTDMNGMPNRTTTSEAMGGMSGMSHGSTAAPMPGMMTDNQMSQLKAATGTAFDKLFLQLMITHHQGALEMAKTEKTSGQNPAAQALADSIISSQTAEITTMRDMLKAI